MARTALLLASLASAAAHLEFGNYKTVQLENEVVSFLAVGEWGGQDEAPFTTPGQTAVAGGMAGAVADTLSTFVLSPGGNFYGQGIQGARSGSWQQRWVRSDLLPHRPARTPRTPSLCAAPSVAPTPRLRPAPRARLSAARCAHMCSMHPPL